MRQIVQSWSPGALLVSALVAASEVTAQQPAPQPPQAFPGPDVQDLYLRWPLPPGAEGYADIDGRRILQDVVAQAEISRRYRDQIYPKYWGRIIGMESDHWAAGPTWAPSTATCQAS